MTTPFQGAQPSEKAEIAQQILTLISDPRSTARQIGSVIEGLPSLRQSVMFSAVDGLAGRGVVRTSAQAVVLIGFNRLKELVREFIDMMLTAATAITSSPHRLTSPIPNIGGVQAGHAEN